MDSSSSTQQQAERDESVVDVMVEGVATAPVRPRRQTGEKWLNFWARSRKQILGALGFLVVFGLWQLCAELGLVDTNLVGSPVGIIQAIGPYFGEDGSGGSDMLVSAKEFGIGFALALTAGLIIGAILGFSATLNDMFQPLLSFMNAAPNIALVPMLVVIFGIGIYSKVAVVFIAAVFAIIINTADGIALADAQLRRVARSFGGSRFQVLRTVQLPSAFPVIVTGIRLAIGHGLVGMVGGELIASTAGLGYTIARAGNSFQPNLVLLAVAVIAGTSVVITAILRFVERRLGRWRPIDA